MLFSSNYAKNYASTIRQGLTKRLMKVSEKRGSEVIWSVYRTEKCEWIRSQCKEIESAGIHWVRIAEIFCKLLKKEAHQRCGMWLSRAINFKDSYFL